jgi:DNA-binding response OmpR family regulator
VTSLSGNTVVSVGTIPELLSLRAAILQSAGYAVFTTTVPQEAIQEIRSGHCGVLLLCYSVSEESRQELIREFRERCASGRIIAITNRPVAETPKQVDELVYGVEGPEILLQAVNGKAA